MKKALHILLLAATATAATGVLAAPRSSLTGQQANAARPARAGTAAWRMLRITGQLPPASPPHQAAQDRSAVPPTLVPSSVALISYPGTPYTAAVGQNPGAGPHAKHYMVGVYGSPLGGTRGFYGFRATLSEKKSTQIEAYQPVLPGMGNMYPYAINDHGDIVGENWNNFAEGFLLSGGTVTAISVPFTGADQTSANDINNAGLIVGAWSADGGETEHGFTLKNGTYAQLPDYPNASQTWPWSINNKGDIVGYVSDSAGNTHGYLQHNGTYALLDVPGAAYTIAVGVNDSDQVVGLYCVTVADCTSPNNNTHGFLYSNGGYTTLDIPGTTDYEAETINNAGQIAAFYMEGSGYLYSYLLTP
jgi:uncharacterized membrane protein